MRAVLVVSVAALALLAACAPLEGPPASEPNETGNDSLVGFSACGEERPEVCTMEYRPVCGSLSNGSVQTFGNACSACADRNVTGYYDGTCADQLFVVCEQTTTGFSAEQYARDSNASCVDTCPTGYDDYTTQIGVRLCIEHYGAEEIAQWPVCARSNETCECVRATETTSGEPIADPQYRCVPEQYAERLLFRSGQDRLDENGDSSVLIA